MIPKDHIHILSRCKRYFIFQNRDPIPYKEKVAKAYTDVRMLYEENGYKAIRYAYKNATSISSFKQHARNRSTKKPLPMFNA